MSSLPSTMKAVVINGNKAKIAEVNIPQVRSTYLLAKVEAVALNPTDWKHITYQLAAPNAISGCDFAGTVIEVGPEVSKSLKPGERIAGTTHGANFSNAAGGCFAEYCLAKADLVVKLPDSLSFDSAATFPLGVSTVGQGLFQQALKLELPEANNLPAPGSKGPILIYGGSSATGTLGIQFARLAGYKVLTTCSPHNEALVRSLGAEAVYNYRDADCGQQIRRDTDDQLTLAWDTISSAASAQICADALSSNGAACRYGGIVNRGDDTFPRKDVTATTTFMYTIFNEAFQKRGQEFPARAEDFEFAKRMFGLTEVLLAEGKFRPHAELVRQDGLVGALQGLQDLKEERVSGKKLVFRVGETPEDGEGKEVEL